MLAITCPQCASGYEVPDRLAGKQLRCLRCHALFPAGSVADLPVLDVVAVADGITDARPRRPARPERRRRLPEAPAPRGLPRIGLVVTTVLALVATLLTTAGVLIARLVPPRPTPPAALAEFAAAAGNAPDAVLAARPRPPALPVPRLPAVDLPVPVSADGGTLIRVRHATPEVAGYVLDVPAQELLPDLVWYDDGSCFLCLERGGKLRLVRTADAALLRTLDLKRSCGGLAGNAAFAFVAVPEVGEVTVLHADTLRQQARLAVPAPGRLVAAHNGATAFAIPDVPQRLYFLDPLGPAVAEKRAYDFAADDVAFRAAGLSPTGRRLFTLGTRGQVQRFDVPGFRGLFHEQDSPVGDDPTALLIATDGTAVATVARGRLVVYAAGDLSRPLYEVANPPVRPLALGPGGLIAYGSTATAQLAALDLTTGKLRWSASFGGTEPVRALALSPTGDRLLLLTEHRLILCQFPTNEKRP